MEFYQKNFEDVLLDFQVTEKGLSQAEAQKRLQKFGQNILIKKKKKTIFNILWGQISNFLIILLIISAIVSFILEGPNINTIVLMVVIFLNIIMGFAQEYKAEKAIQALEKLAPLKADVRRNGIDCKIPASQIVPGDIVILKQGGIVPTDIRISESNNLKVDESSLTGESVPSHKNPHKLSKTLPAADQENMVFMGTQIVFGHGEGIVTACGNNTQFGKIAHLVQKKEERTPLQKRLTYLGKILTLISGLLVLLIFGLGLWRGLEIGPLFSYVIALLVSAVPESLPTITTLALALGIINLARRKAIIRRLPVIESLASVNVICSDKTGTITKDEMTIKAIWVYDHYLQISGEGYDPTGKFLNNGLEITPSNKPGLKKLIEAGEICNNSKLIFNQARNLWQISGDPTEGAFRVLAQKSKIDFKFNKLKEFPFDFNLKRMSQIAALNNQKFLYSKGAPDKILAISKFVEAGNKTIKITPKIRQEILKQSNSLAQEGFRVLGLGYKKINQLENNRKLAESDLIFLGVVGMIDPPAEDVKEAIDLTKKAGIKTIMITGDHQITAKKVALQIGLSVSDDQILEGSDLEKISSEELEKIVDDTVIFARTSPEQKIKIVKALQTKGYLVAVTGDGINDSPALKQADVGIAMGKRGTDVAKESADMILIDDRFPTIVNAIEYGRSIYDNIRKFFTFLLSGNFSELSLVTFAFIVGLPQPFTTIQILWINLVTDSFPAIALAFEKPHSKVMTQKPKDPSKSILKPVLKQALFLGILGLIFEIILFLNYLDFDPGKAQTLIFTFCVFFELFIVFSIRSDKPFWQRKVFENKVLIWAVLLSAVLQILVLYGPLQSAFQTTSLGVVEWVLIISGSAICFFISEASKMLKLWKT